MKKYVMGSALFLTILATSAVGAWNVSPCSTSDLAKHSTYIDRIRHARPTDVTIYVPKPLPTTNNDVIEDFDYQFRYLRSVQPAAQITPLDRTFLSLLNDGRLQTVVLRVENWTGRRCLGPADGDRIFLLRFYDTRTHAEVARASLEDSGILAITAYREANVNPQWWTVPIEEPDTAARAVGAIVGERLVDAQYVTTYGTFECHELLPCIAMRSPSTNTTYVLDPSGRIVSFPTNAKRFSRRRDLLRVEDIDKVKRTLAPGQKLMSLGGDIYVVVEPVK